MCLFFVTLLGLLNGSFSFSLVSLPCPTRGVRAGAGGRWGVASLNVGAGVPKEGGGGNGAFVLVFEAVNAAVVTCFRRVFPEEGAYRVYLIYLFNVRPSVARIFRRM